MSSADWAIRGMNPEEYGYSLCKVFDEWVRRDLGKALVSHFETLVAQHLGLPGSTRRVQQIAMPSALVGRLLG